MKVGYAGICTVLFWILNVNITTAVSSRFLTAGAFKHFPIAMAQNSEADRPRGGHRHDTNWRAVKRIGGGETLIVVCEPIRRRHLDAGGRLAQTRRIDIGKDRYWRCRQRGVRRSGHQHHRRIQTSIAWRKSISYPNRRAVVRPASTPQG